VFLSSEIAECRSRNSFRECSLYDLPFSRSL